MKRKTFSATVAGNLIRRGLGSDAEILNQIAWRHTRRAGLGVFLLALMLGAIANGFAQGSMAEVSAAQQAAPFGVSNPKNRKWPVDEAVRIYFSACERVARSIRPVNPPHLRPSFVLVLGAQNNETMRDGKVTEVRLKNWDSTTFAQAVVILAAREILSSEDVAHITREALTYAEASASVSDLRQEP